MLKKHYVSKFPHGIMFHHFHGKNHPKIQGSLGQEDLINIINFIGKENILTASEWVEGIQNNCLKSNQVCLTFDDGIKSQFDLALPVLQSHNLTGFWFTYSSIFQGFKEKLEIYRYYRTVFFSNVDDFYEMYFKYLEESYLSSKIKIKIEKFNPIRYLNSYSFYSFNDKKFRFIRDEILTPKEYFSIMDEIILNHKLDLDKISKELWFTEKELKQIHDLNNIIGLHSYSHPTRLARLSHKEQKEEYTKNKNHLEGIVGNIFCMSHPTNSYNKNTLNILNELDIKFGFCATMESPNKTKLEIPRQDHADIISRMYN